MTPDPASQAADRELLAKKDRLLDGFTLEMGAFSTEDLRAMADDSERVSPDGWLHKMIREYVSVWR